MGSVSATGTGLRWLMPCVVATMSMLPNTVIAQTLPLSIVQAPGQPAETDAARSDLILTGSLSGGYDANSFHGLSGSSGPQSSLFRRGASNLGGNLQLSYLPTTSRRANFGFSGGSSFRMYQGSDFIPVSHAIAAGVSAGLTQHLSVQASGMANYAPRYQFDFLPGASSSLGGLALSPIDYTLSVHHTLNYGLGAGLSYRPTKRSSFDATYAFNDLRTDRAAIFRGKTQQAGVSYRLGIAKGLGVRLGYRSQLGRYADPATGEAGLTRADNIDMGLDYGLGRGLTLSRKTTVTFAFGLGTSNYGRATRLQVVGNSSLRHQLSRSWSVGAGYGRGLNFVDGFAAPLFSDSATVRVGGTLGLRLRFDASTAYSLGGVDTPSAKQKFQSHRSVVGLRGRLTRHFDAFGQYFFYHHEFDDSSFLIQGAPPNLSRQGLRAGLSLSMPLRSARTP